MIPKEEIVRVAQTLGISPNLVEKDYVLGWVLWGLYQHPILRESLVFKGGNCLRKVYFPHTRFSEDLDFTVHRLDIIPHFADYLREVGEIVAKTAGIPLLMEQTVVKEKATPDELFRAVDARLYFGGLSGRGSVTMRIKFDISEYERIVLPLQKHPLQHCFSDQGDCHTRVLTYSLEEVLAEKLRSWVQRTRPRDLFDVVTIVQSGAVPISKSNILHAFLQKTIFKQVPLAGREEMLAPAKFESIRKHWQHAITHTSEPLQAASEAISSFTNFVRSLFDPAVLASVGVTANDLLDYNYQVRSHIREAIIEAGKAKQLIRICYAKQERDVEPYSFRYKVTKRGTGAEYFYGFDRSRGDTIKSFFLHKIEGVSILPQAFRPRWDVEF